MRSDPDGLLGRVTGGASGSRLAVTQDLSAGEAWVAHLDLQPDVPEPLIGARCDNASARAAVGEVLERLSRLDVVGVARTVRAPLPALRRSPIAAVVVAAAKAGLPQRAVRSASKGAVQSLVRAIAADHVTHGIRVNAVAPGTVGTPWVARPLGSADDHAVERAALNAPQRHRRLFNPREVAAAVAYLVSVAAGSITGVCLAADRGMDGMRLRPRS